jgi:uncharacterized protein (DUF58 family)
MTIFTKRGGQLVFAGIFSISIAIALAGYQAIGIITNTFLGPLFGGEEGGINYADWYGGDVEGNNVFSLLMVWFGEFMTRGILGDLVYIDSQFIFYFIIIGVFLIFSVVSGYPAFAAGADPKSIKIERVLGKVKGFAGDYVYIELRIKNKSLNPIPVLEIYDAYPEVFDLVLGENFITTQLASKQATSFAYIVQIPVRGRFLIGPTKIILHDRQGFFSSEAVLAELSEVLVYPSYEDIKKLEMMGDKRKLGNLFGAHKTKIKGGGTDFFGIRQFNPGDPLKLVHWPSFAKTGGETLMVREFESEQNIRVMVLLDASASMGAGLPRNTKLEFSIRSAVMMAYLALEKKDTVGLCVFDEEVRTYMEPSGSQSFMYRYLEEMANIKPQGHGKLEEAVDYLLPRIGKASYIIILSDLEMGSEEVVEAVKKLRANKHRVFIISPFGPSFETRISELSVTERLIGEAIEISYQEQRKNLFKMLKGLDTTVISVGPDDMLANVISSFSKLKSTS